MLILNYDFFKALLLSVRRKSDFNGKKIDKTLNYQNFFLWFSKDVINISKIDIINDWYIKFYFYFIQLLIFKLFEKFKWIKIVKTIYFDS